MKKFLILFLFIASVGMMFVPQYVKAGDVCWCKYKLPGDTSEESLEFAKLDTAEKCVDAQAQTELGDLGTIVAGTCAMVSSTEPIATPATIETGVIEKTKTPLPSVALQNPLGTTDFIEIMSRVVNSAMGLIGGLTLLVFIYGGFMWLTAAGNAEQVKKGTQAMLWAGIGLFIIFGSYGILKLIIGGLGA